MASLGTLPYYSTNSFVLNAIKNKFLTITEFRISSVVLPFGLTFSKYNRYESKFSLSLWYYVLRMDLYRSISQRSEN